jgi:hypothetical protein
MTTLKGQHTVNSTLGTTLYTTLTLVTTILVTGCAGGPHIGFEVYTMDATYHRDCVGVNARYRSTDRECQQRHEPHTQSNQVHRIPKFDELEPWQQDIVLRQRCRATGRDCPQGLK